MRKKAAQVGGERLYIVVGYRFLLRVGVLILVLARNWRLTVALFRSGLLVVRL